jgi:hypothetical protein
MGFEHVGVDACHVVILEEDNRVNAAAVVSKHVHCS